MFATGSAEDKRKGQQGNRCNRNGVPLALMKSASYGQLRLHKANVSHGVRLIAFRGVVSSDYDGRNQNSCADQEYKDGHTGKLGTGLSAGPDTVAYASDGRIVSGGGLASDEQKARRDSGDGLTHALIPTIRLVNTG